MSDPRARRTTRAWRCVGVALLAACAGEPGAGGRDETGSTEDAASSTLPESPSTWTAEGMTLTLLEDGTFRLRAGSAGDTSGAPQHDVGRWRDAGDGTVEIAGARGTLRAVVGTVGGAATLRVTARAGDVPGPPPPYGLARAAALDPVDEPMRLRGMMTYFADAGRFGECATGASYWIVPEGDAAALERGYLRAVEGPGAPVLVTVEGTLTRRPGMEGGEVDALVVERFLGAHADEGCDAGPLDRPIEGTDWLLEALPGATEVPEGTDASLRLEPEGRVASGSTGCNRFNGTYELTGPRLTVAPGVMTRMACPGGADRLERGFLEALRVTGSVRVIGDRLELLGADGVVARFRAAS